MPESDCVLVVLIEQALLVFGALRSEPPVVTKLMLPVSRTKRVIAWAPASRAPSSAQAAKTKRHPRPHENQGPRMPRLDGTLMDLTLGTRAAVRRDCFS